MADEDEVLMEVEAVEAVYGDDCKVVQRFPPHLQVHIKPRTADDSSQQFVEAVLEFHASLQYPSEPPSIGILDSKGLDEKRQAHLMTGVQEKASELSSYLMLVALCEEAVEMLSNMNHPDGDCPMCLYPLVKDDAPGDVLPFMKLMSCFHCFHSTCVIRWWNWLQEQGERNPSSSSHASASSSTNPENQYDSCGNVKEKEGNCPVCRKVFHAADVEHVLNLAETYRTQLDSDETFADDEEFLQSEAEKLRKLNFESVLKLQEEKKGLIEPKRDEVLRPGMFLPEPAPLPTISKEETSELENTEANSVVLTSETGPSGSSKNTQRNDHKKQGMRKYRNRNPRYHNSRWIKRENTTG